MTETAIQKYGIGIGNKGVVLATVDDAFRFADAVRQSSLAPKCFDTTQKIMIAIQSGQEIGLSPMRSLQSIAVINGRVCLWGDAALGLVKSSGLAEYVKEWIDGEGEDMVAHCESKRKDSPEPVETSFSVDDAKQATLWGKAGTWKTYPKRMLKYRARGFNLRDNFADVLYGFHIAEEMQDTPPEQAHTVQTPRRDERKAKAIESTVVDSATKEAMLKGVFGTFQELTKEDNLSIRFFPQFVAYALGGSKQDYLDDKGYFDPDKVDVEGLQKLNAALQGGLPEVIAEMIGTPESETENAE